MSPDRQEDQLRRLFAELREADARRAPAFDDVWRATAARAERPVRRPLVGYYAAAAVVALLAGGLLVGVSRLGRSRGAVVALSQWESPTAFLLSDPGGNLLTGVPPISSSVIQLAGWGLQAPRP